MAIKSKTDESKTNGWVLSIDPGSNLLGVSLFLDGNFIAGRVLASANARDPLSRRLQHILPQLSDFLSKYVGNEIIYKIVCEGVRSRLVQITVGAVLTNPHICANLSPTGSFVETGSWKSYAKIHGASGPHKDVKGVKALREIGWDFQKYPVDSDDVADSVLVFLCWAGRV